MHEIITNNEQPMTNDQPPTDGPGAKGTVVRGAAGARELRHAQGAAVGAWGAGRASSPPVIHSFWRVNVCGLGWVGLGWVGGGAHSSADSRKSA